MIGHLQKVTRLASLLVLLLQADRTNAEPIAKAAGLPCEVHNSRSLQIPRDDNDTDPYAFLLTLNLRADSPGAAVRFYCGREASGIRTLVCSANGLPWAISVRDGVFFLLPNDSVAFVRNLHIRVQLNRGLQPRVSAESGGSELGATLDIYSLVHAVDRRGVTWHHDVRNKRMKTSTTSGLDITLDLSNRFERGSLSFSKLDVSNQLIGSFTVEAVTRGEPSFPRLSQAELAIRDGVVGQAEEVVGSPEVVKRLFPLDNPTALEKLLASEVLAANGKKWQDFCLRATPYKQANLAASLETIEEALRSQEAACHLQEYVGQLNSLLGDTVYKEVSRSFCGTPNFASGWDVSLSREVALWSYGAETLARARRALLEVIKLPQAASEAKVGAADCLAILGGVVEGELDDVVSSGQSSSGELCNALLRVRSRLADTGSIERLLQAVRSSDSTRRLRLLSIEALLLANQCDDIEEIFRKELRRSMGTTLEARCIRAAATHASSRAWLRCGVKEGWECCTPEIALPLLRWAIPFDSQEWISLYALAKEVQDISPPASAAAIAAERITMLKPLGYGETEQ